MTLYLQQEQWACDMSLAVYTAITYLFKEELFELFLALGVSVTLLLQLPGEFCLSLLVLVLKRIGWRLGVSRNFRLLYRIKSIRTKNTTLALFRYAISWLAYYIIQLKGEFNGQGEFHHKIYHDISIYPRKGTNLEVFNSSAQLKLNNLRWLRRGRHSALFQPPQVLCCHHSLWVNIWFIKCNQCDG